jgi:predicted alpha-1,2-mannosidase
MYKRFYPLISFIGLSCLFLLMSCCNCDQSATKLVNPFIGTDGHGHTFPGASMPFGMVQLSPDTRKDNWDACSGYHYSDSTILGFSHTHLSGTGCGDYGDIRIMPITGSLRTRPGDDSKSGYRSGFSHKKEKASPGYYEVFLEDPKIDAELTVTSRCGLHQYTFTETGDSYIIIDLTEAAVTENHRELFAEVVNDHAIAGYRRSSGWAADQFVFFYAEFSKPFIESGIASEGEIKADLKEAKGNDIQAFAKFPIKAGDKLLVKVGISAVSIEGARKNLEAEIPAWDFRAIRENAEMAWEKVLSKIEVKDKNKTNKIKFYTALYHCYLVPNLYSDIDGQYRGHDGNVHQGKGHQVYTVFSLWDTYRALHPLMTILEPEKTNDFIRTFLDIYEKGGLLPVWELAGNETNCMIGYHAVPVIADAYIKGINDYDADEALTAAIKSAGQDQFGLKYYRRFGYIPAESEGESVSKTLEYAYDDWCIAIMAKKMGKEQDFRDFIERAQYYKNLYEPVTKFLRGKRNGMFTEPFNPTEVNFMLTEANSWQYTFYVPQDISGLSTLMGGDEMFEKKLDDMFSATEDLSGRDQSDITGMIGQYAHGNEPSHHMAYLYNYVGNPAKTQKLARQIMDQLYGTDAAGLCGNEDCGQMSAWFVMSALGFYPVTPASGYYTIGSPLFEKTIIHFDNGKSFTIKSNGSKSQGEFIQSARLNGSDYKKSYLWHEALVNGGEIEFSMGKEPGANWGTAPEDRPVSAISDHLIIPVPYFQAASSSFQDSLSINIKDIDKGATIYCQIPADDQSKVYQEYKNPVYTDKNLAIKAFAMSKDTVKSKDVEASFHKIHNNWNVSIKNRCSPQYDAGGNLALIDGMYGGPNFRTGAWQGYHGVDFEVVVDFGKITSIKKVIATFLQDQNSWIFMPTRVEFAVSNNNVDFKTVAEIKNDIPDNLDDAVIKDFEKFGLRENCRYLRVRAINRGACPPWHAGAGDQTWIFVDEIAIE